ncbi:MAG: hypothetical protein BWK80_52880 [Desulfobacteraceae bacterium IS3]|nr:MAG: hypothetical protein BWK80_52880 [Desulfobacteraceae bacterium IS3]
MDIKKIGMISTAVLVFLAAITTSAMAAAPSAPSNLICTSGHTAGVSSTETVIKMNWTASTDTDGDLAGYIIKWDNDPDTVFAASDLLATSTSTSFDASPDGNWYFHIRATDGANLSSIVTAGPFVISTQPSISAVTPSSGAAGTAIKITGTGFTVGSTSVKIGTADMTTVTHAIDKEITVTVPSTLGVGTYSITVSCGTKSVTKSNCFTVSSSSGNNAPQVNAGKDKTTDVGAAVTFNDATASDSDGDTLIYVWSVSEAPSGATAGTDYTLTSTSSLNASFTPLTEKANGTFKLNLTVSDTKTSVSDTVLVVVGVIIGDVNGDKKLDIADAISVFTALVGKSSDGVKLTSFVNADGKITPADASFVLMQLAKK